MSIDNTEALRRRQMIKQGQPYIDLARADQRWDTDQLRAEFEVLGFLAPFVVVKRKVDGVKGSMEFTHNPRWYFNFTPDEGEVMSYAIIDLANRVQSEIRHATGRSYAIDLYVLDRDSLQQMLRMLRDIDYDKRAALNKARMQPWRRA